MIRVGADAWFDIEEWGYLTRKVDGVTIIYIADQDGPEFADTVEESLTFFEEALNIDISGGIVITNMNPVLTELLREQTQRLREKAADDPDMNAETKEWFENSSDLEIVQRMHKNNLGTYHHSDSFIFLNLVNLPKPGSKGFNNTLWHELAHRIDNNDGNDWQPPTVNEPFPFGRIRGISRKYMNRIGEAYGYREKLRNEYFADLVQAWVGTQFYEKPPQFGSRVGHRKLDPVEIEDMHHLIAYLEEEVSQEFPLTDRAGEKPVLVSFAVPDGTREVLEVDQSDLDDLPESAIRLDRPEEVAQMLGLGDV